MNNWTNYSLDPVIPTVTPFPRYGPSSSACLITNKQNRTIITNLYGGIPETLILNVIAWLIFVVLFSVLRQQAWDYGRLALVNSGGEKKRWTQIFYAPGNEPEIVPVENRPSNGSTAASPITSQMSIQSAHQVDRGFLSWFWVTLKLKKEQILMHSGPDAVHYLSFQQHLMVVMAVITFFSLALILPINFQGTLSGDVNSFGHSTLSNLEANSPLLWIHVLVAIGYVPLVVLVMRRASGRNAFKTAPTRTIMATNISSEDRQKEAIKDYLTERFPELGIDDIQLAYNLSKLTEVNEEYEQIRDARIYCETHKGPGMPPLTARPNCFTCKTVDALDYYQEREFQLHGEVARLRASALNDPLGIAFITVATTQAAQQMIAHFKPGIYREWNLTYAPAPSDLFWENLSVGSSRWYIKWACVNFCLFLFLFFITTPIYVVNLYDRMSGNSLTKFSPLVSEFLPTLLLWTMAALMPVIVAFSDKWLSHWTRSKQNYSIMTKSFGYLLFMILILPSMGLTSAQAFLEWTFHINEKNSTYRWECIFLPDKGAFFVNYIITTAFIGTSLELLRFPELIVYVWKLLTANSRAETPYIRRSILIEFPFGQHYAWTVLVFTMSTVYSVICPLIMPFAMVYICLKHFGDRHNLYFAYGPSNMMSQRGGKIHSTAVTMTKFSIILLLIILAALSFVRGGGVDARGIVLVICLAVTMTLFTFMSPIKRCTTKRPSIEEHHGPTPIYVAPVLLSSNRIDFTDSAGHMGYGSYTDTDTMDQFVSEETIMRNLPA